MKTLHEIKKTLAEHKEELREKYGVKEIGIFGSYLTGKTDRESDLDILVEFEGRIDFFIFLDVKEELEYLLDMKVDLVMKKALKSEMGRQIMKSVVYV